nr:hemogen isoform X1 [Anolis sagrei ordinatus]
MASLEEDHSYSGNPQQPAATAEEYAVPEVVITRRLRDRELLRKRRAEAEEKDTHQWVLGDQQKSKRARKGRGAGRGRGRRQAEEPQPETQSEIPLEVAEEREPEAQATQVEEKAEVTLVFPAETSIPLVEAEEPYTPQQEAAEQATPASEPFFSPGLEGIPSSEEPEIPKALENDHLEQEFYGSF